MKANLLMLRPPVLGAADRVPLLFLSAEATPDEFFIEKAKQQDGPCDDIRAFPGLKK